MKKLSVFMLAIVLVCAMAFPTSAASAFEKITVDANTVVIDATEDQGRNGAAAGYVDGYGIGNTWLDDVVAFEALDFGANGADEVTISFAFGQEGSGIDLALYVDSLDSDPVATWRVNYEDTLGWDEASQKDFTKETSIPAGVHTVYLRWESAESGSLYGIQFAEADPPPVEETTAAAETVAPTTPSSIETAAQTADFGIVAGAAALVCAALSITVSKSKGKK